MVGDIALRQQPKDLSEAVDDEVVELLARQIAQQLASPVTDELALLALQRRADLADGGVEDDAGRRRAQIRALQSGPPVLTGP